MAVMSAFGDLPKVDAVINADPGFESQQNYNSITWYLNWLNDHGLHTEVIKSEGNIKTDYLSNHVHIPFWTESGAPLRRQCTQHYKLIPNKRRYREFAGYDSVKAPHPKPGEFEVWIGFTLDEHERRSVSRYKYMVHRWPLIELGLTREHCIAYLQDHGLPIPPKSACVICPYRRAADWIIIRDHCPDDWRDAVEIDKQIRNARPLPDTTYDKIYLWRGLVPLDQADFEKAARSDEARRKDTAHQIIICDGGSCWT
jgi:hypothetical protein